MASWFVTTILVFLIPVSLFALGYLIYDYINKSNQKKHQDQVNKCAQYYADCITDVSQECITDGTCTTDDCSAFQNCENNAKDNCTDVDLSEVKVNIGGGTYKMSDVPC